MPKLNLVHKQCCRMILFYQISSNAGLVRF